MPERNPHIENARKQINEILRQLELDTGMLVKNISLDGINIRTANDPTDVILWNVRIEMYRLPGHLWVRE